MIYVSLVASDGSTFAKDIHKALHLVVRCAHKNAPGLVDGSCGYRFEKIDFCAGFDLRNYFEEVARTLARWLDEDSVTCLVSKVAFENLNPLKPDGLRGESLLAMLVLAFPEVRWLFAMAQGEHADRFLSRHGLTRLFKPNEPTLFDGLGLRDEVRRNIRDKEDSGVFYLPKRTHIAVAMDEETDYAYLHAWAAYRFGFRVRAVGRKELAGEIFGRENQNGKSQVKLDDLPCLVLEDVYLNFPDDSEKGLSDLQERSKKLSGLDEVPNRILVTSGHDVAKQQINRSYICDRQEAGKWIRYLYKPHAGIFSLWKEAELSERHFRCDDISGEPGVAPGFQWPPELSCRSENDDHEQSSSHSSPGILVEISCHMLNRAERMLNDGIATVEQAVHGAVLASDALELLGCKTPTMSAEALALKHQFELHAECQFCGVEHHLSMKERLKEIERDADAIARWFHPSIRRKTALNIRLDVVNKLVRILRDYNQFDEERYCMVEARDLHRKVYVHERKWRWMFWPFLWYADWLLSSFSRFAIAIVLWVGGVWLLYTLGGIEGGSDNDQGGVFTYAIATFFGANTTIVADNPLLGTFAILGGLFHLGIFISLIYDLVNRR